MSKKAAGEDDSPSYKDDELVINYHDAVIYGSDLKLVQSETAWLNDSCILFYMTYLEKKYNDGNTFIKMMDPSVTSYFMHQCVDDDEIGDFVSGFQLPTVTDEAPPSSTTSLSPSSFSTSEIPNLGMKVIGKIFIPINDNMSISHSRTWTQPGGGNHWSLLLLVLSNSTFGGNSKLVSYIHLDSIQNSHNSVAAADVVTKLNRYIFEPNGYMPFTSKVLQQSKNTPQQRNSYDCGIHMLMAIEQILLTNSDTTSTLLLEVQQYERILQEYVRNHPTFCQELRSTISNTIVDIAAKSSASSKKKAKTATK